MEVISTTGSLMINHSGSSETLPSLLIMLLRSMMMIQTIFVLMMQRILSIMCGVKVSGQEKTQ